MDETKLKCPVCGYTDRILVRTSVLISVGQEGEDLEEDIELCYSSLDYQDEDTGICKQKTCGHTGPIQTFLDAAKRAVTVIDTIMAHAGAYYPGDRLRKCWNSDLQRAEDDGEYQLALLIVREIHDAYNEGATPEDNKARARTAVNQIIDRLVSVMNGLC